MAKNQEKISQSNSGSMSGSMQASIGNYNQLTTNQFSAEPAKPLTSDEIVAILEEIEQIILLSTYQEKEKDETSKYLDATKSEVVREDSDKVLVSKNLERVVKNLEQADQAVDASERIFLKVVPLIGPIVSWLGSAAGNIANFFP